MTNASSSSAGDRARPPGSPAELHDAAQASWPGRPLAGKWYQGGDVMPVAFVGFHPRTGEPMVVDRAGGIFVVDRDDLYLDPLPAALEEALRDAERAIEIETERAQRAEERRRARRAAAEVSPAREPQGRGARPPHVAGVSNADVALLGDVGTEPDLVFDALP
jgi:hypothetical protein